MKKYAFLMIALMGALLAGCEPIENDLDNGRGEQVEPGKLLLTVKATKDMDTKALSLDGTTLNAYWTVDDKVKVFLDGTCIGTLDVTPAAGEKPTEATLQGTLTQTTGLVEGAVLYLLIPRETWNYTNQDGGEPSASSTLSTMFDYSMAKLTITSVSGININTNTTARFVNQQSVYKFGFKIKDTETAVRVSQFTIISSNNKIANSVAYDGSGKQWKSTFGSLTVSSSSTTNPRYVALRYGDYTDNTTAREADNFSFNVIDNNNKVYVGGKAIAADKLVYGKFLNATGIEVSQVKFAPSTTETNSVW